MAFRVHTYAKAHLSPEIQIPGSTYLSRSAPKFIPPTKFCEDSFITFV